MLFALAVVKDGKLLVVGVVADGCEIHGRGNGEIGMLISIEARHRSKARNGGWGGSYAMGQH